MPCFMKCQVHLIIVIWIICIHTVHCLKILPRIATHRTKITRSSLHFTTYNFPACAYCLFTMPSGSPFSEEYFYVHVQFTWNDTWVTWLCLNLSKRNQVMLRHLSLDRHYGSTGKEILPIILVQNSLKVSQW